MTETKRLSAATLASLPKEVAQPAYDRAAIETGIVHLGVGAFNRAHQAAYVDDALARGETGWGIVAASLRSAATRDALKPQDGLYTLAIRGETTALRIIGAIQDVLVAPEDPAGLIAAMSRPSVKIVTLTVTEKGYCHDPATGTLAENHPDIVHDLANPDRPRSAPGFLAAALKVRRAAGTPPFTVVSCDNLPANGKTLKRVLTRYAELLDPALGRHVADEVAFPSTMVDRIVPATTDADRAMVAEALGLTDAWPVMGEPFAQWVIEDHFPAGRPRFELSGAELVSDVEPFELMKLRLLNGAHSTLAYLGRLLGLETVADAMNDADLPRVLDGVWREAAPTLAETIDTAAYTARLVERFRNPSLRHRLVQIAMDGSQKLPQRLLGPIRDNLAAGRPIDHLALAVAAWMRFAAGRDADGGEYALNDPLEARLKVAANQPTPEVAAKALLAIDEVFGKDLRDNPQFTVPVTAALARLWREGARAVVAETGA